MSFLVFRRKAVVLPVGMEIRVLRSDEVCTHLAMCGRMDTIGILGIESGFRALMRGGEVSVILELSEVTLLVSVGMRMLIESGKELLASGSELILIGPRGIVEETLRIAKMDSLFKIVGSVEEAQRLLQRG